MNTSSLASWLNESSLKEKGEAAIAAIRSLKSDNPDPEIIQKLVGWGTLAPILQASIREESGFKKEQFEQLQELLSEQELNQAIENSFNAFHTPIRLAEAIWKCVEHIGFRGGNILEIGAGTGIFPATMPFDRTEVSYIAIEQDPIAESALRVLHPWVRSACSTIEKMPLQADVFDLAIGNLPFGETIIKSKDEFGGMALNLHNYCLARAVKAVRPGGLIVVLTSTWFLDSEKYRPFREYLGSEATPKVALLQAFRMPQGIFSDNAHTESSADLLIFQKLSDPLKQATAPNGDWMNLKTLYKDDVPFTISNFYDYKAKNILGILEPDTRHPGKLVVTRDLRDPATEIESLIKYTHSSYVESESKRPEIELIPAEFADHPNGSYLLLENIPYRKSEDGLRVERVDDRHARKIRSYLGLHSALQNLLSAQTSIEEDGPVEQCRKIAKLAYQSFKAKNGKLTSKNNRELLICDYRFSFLSSIEETSILETRTAWPIKEPASANSPSEALIHSLQWRNKVDLPYIASLLNSEEETVTEFLSKHNRIFFDPIKEEWQLTSRYLSGNIYEKIDAAYAANLLKNVEALQTVLPPLVLPSEMSPSQQMALVEHLKIDLEAIDPDDRKRMLDDGFDLRMNSAWLPRNILNEFLSDIFKQPVKAIKLPAPALTWVLEDLSKSDRSLKAANSARWSTREVSVFYLVKSALNFSKIKIYEDGEINPEESLIAENLVLELEEEFKRFIFDNLERSAEVTLAYNRALNCYAPEKFDGSHLLLPSADQELLKLKPNRPHQNNAIWRTLQDRVTLIPHQVGSGKTRIMIAAAMECRRRGLAKKPMFVALKSTISQIEKAFRELYPSANLLVANEKNFSAKNRGSFLAAIAGNDWDCVIVSHDNWSKMTMSPDYKVFFVQQQKARLEEIASKEAAKKEREPLVKELGKTLKRLNARIRKTAKAKNSEDGIYFNELGVDMVVFDEFDTQKNLYNDTPLSRLPGISTTSSMRAEDTLMKFTWLHQQNARIVTATGTPIANSMVELFTQFRYHRPEVLENLKCPTLNDFISNFISISAKAEILSTGKYDIRERAREFFNIPELIRVFRLFADIVPEKYLNIPKPIAHRIPISCPPTPDQKRYVKNLLKRASLVEAKRVDPSEDNKLKITNDGRHNSLDPRLTMEFADNMPQMKTNQAPWVIWQIWRSTQKSRATQIVFLDISSPKKEFNNYHSMRQVLIDLGVESKEIAFIHEAKNDKARAKICERMNSGEIRVLFASTSKGGVGLNVQERLIASHDIDAPWRPRDIEQRHGRIIRQGNIWPEVFLFNYTTEGFNGQPGFDAYLWQTLETKARQFNTFLQGDLNGPRRISADDEITLSFAEIKAIASGDPIIKEHADLSQELNTLKIRKRRHDEDARSIASRLRGYTRKIDDLLGTDEKMGLIARTEADIAAAAKISLEKTPVTILKKEFKPQPQNKHLQDVGVAIYSAYQSILRKYKGASTAPIKIGSFGDFSLLIQCTLAGGILIISGNSFEEYRINEQAFPDKTHTGYKNGERLQSFLEKMKETGPDSLLEKYRRSLAEARQNHKDLSSKVDAPFPEIERIKWLEARIKEIEAELVAKKDENDVFEAHDEEVADIEFTADDLDEAECFEELEVEDDVIYEAPHVIEALKNQEYKPVKIKIDGEDTEFDWLAEIKRVTAEDKLIQFPQDRAVKAS